MNELSQKIEAILFYIAEPVKVSFLVKTLEVSKTDLAAALKELADTLQNRGVTLLQHNDEVALTTTSTFAPLIEKIIKEERERDLGRAGIETLTIIAYKGLVSKKEIEFIRGVNSQYGLRNLLLRGLIERKVSEEDERKTVYAITTDTIRYLGLNSITDLPEYLQAQKQLEVTDEPEEENV